MILKGIKLSSGTYTTITTKSDNKSTSSETINKFFNSTKHLVSIPIVKPKAIVPVNVNVSEAKVASHTPKTVEFIKNNNVTSLKTRPNTVVKFESGTFATVKAKNASLPLPVGSSNSTSKGKKRRNNV